MINKKDIFHYTLALTFCIIGGMFGAWSYEFLLGQYTNNLSGAIMSPSIYQVPVANSSNGLIGLGRGYQVVDGVAATDSVLMGLFLKNKEGVYDLTKPNAQALVLTNDGWIITNHNPVDKDFLNDFVVIDSDGSLYQIDQKERDETSNMVFLHLANAKELRVVPFVKLRDLQRGQTLFGVNWLQRTTVSMIAAVDAKIASVKSSEEFIKEIKLVVKPDVPSQLVLIDTRGYVAAVLTSQGRVLATDYFINRINNLLAKDKVLPYYLGVNYVNQSWYHEGGKYTKGVKLVANGSVPAVIKGSPADEIGLREGDVILAVDNMLISRELDLTDLLSEYKLGTKLRLKVLRGDKEQTMDLVLSSK